MEFAVSKCMRAKFLLFAAISVAVEVGYAQNPPQPPEVSEEPASFRLSDVIQNSFSQQSDAPIDEEQDQTNPSVLRDPVDPEEKLPPPVSPVDLRTPFLYMPDDSPRGFSGPSSIVPRETQTTSRFEPVEDRWRLGLPNYDRYGKGHPVQDDYLGVEGTLWDPFNQNVLKGDYPIIGQHIFLRTTARSASLFEGRQLPTPTTPLRSTRNPATAIALGSPNSYQFLQNDTLSFDLFRGNAAFRPPDWRIRLDGVFNMNHLVADVLGVASTDTSIGQSRFRTDFTLQEWFAEAKLLDTSAFYDFASVRVGSQSFTSDFRGFIFADTNRGVRLFGTRSANQEQYNLVWFDQTEKNTNSLLNRIDKDRHQNTFIANYYRQDVIFPGYNVNASFHANFDQGSSETDRNGFQVRPDPVGIAQPHEVNSYYAGFATDGHVERINVSSAAYYVFGRDENNPLAGRPQDISAWMAALELSYDKDWMRFRTSYMFNSGDADPDNSRATGFDAIFANPNFAGSDFSYWGRQAIRLYGVELTNRQSLAPSLRNGKFQSQTNFVNPGLHLANMGVDADLTPKWKLIQNTNLLWFNQTEVLEKYLALARVRNFVGTDISLGTEYRPLLNNNIILAGGLSTLISGDGFQDLFQNLGGSINHPMAGFLETTFQY